MGTYFISAILGLGLAMLFRNACDSKNCISFKGPSIQNIDGKIYQFGDSCYMYDLVPTKCNPNRKTIVLDPPKQTKQNIHTNTINEKKVKSAFNEL